MRDDIVRLVRVLARGIPGARSLYDDYVQEGLLAVWRKGEDADRPLLNVVARRAMASCRRSWFGRKGSPRLAATTALFSELSEEELRWLECPRRDRVALQRRPDREAYDARYREKKRRKENRCPEATARTTCTASGPTA